MNKARTKGPFIIKNEDSLRKGACRQFMMIGKNVKRGFQNIQYVFSWYERI